MGHKLFFEKKTIVEEYTTFEDELDDIFVI
jgi:hypothetical protein